MNKNTCFVTVVFPQNLSYFTDFLDSLEKQTYADFDLLIFNDQVHNIQEYLEHRSLQVKVIDVEGSIAEVRRQLFQYLKKSSYVYCIFGDSDDYFPPHRIENNLVYLGSYDIISNDVFLVKQDKTPILSNYFSQKIQNKQVITYEDIKTKNICGLGNTAIRIDALPEKLDFDESIGAIDWVLFARMLLANKTAIFINDTFIYYRQHTYNAIGMKGLSEERLAKGINIKFQHYLNLYTDYGVMKKEFEEIKRLKEYVSLKPNMTEYYHKILSLNIEAPLWWEEIKTLNEI